MIMMIVLSTMIMMTIYCDLYGDVGKKNSGIVDDDDGKMIHIFASYI